MKRARILLPIILALAAAPLAAQPAASPPLAGRIDGGIYTAAGGIFKVTIPVEPKFGGLIFDTASTVTFEDRSTHVTINVLPMEAEQRWELDLRGRRDYLVYFFSEIVFPGLEQYFPGISAEENARFIPGVQGGALIVYALVPGPSIFKNRVDLSPAAPVASKHGNLLFVKNGCVFLISSELAERITEGSRYHKTPAEENALLRRQLLELLDKMTFPAPPPAAGK